MTEREAISNPLPQISNKNSLWWLMVEQVACFFFCYMRMWPWWGRLRVTAHCSHSLFERNYIFVKTLPLRLCTTCYVRRDDSTRHRIDIVRRSTSTTTTHRGAHTAKRKPTNLIYSKTVRRERINRNLKWFHSQT